MYYREVVAELGNIAPDLIPEAREHLRTITGGEIKLMPFEGDGLMAEIAGDYAALLGKSSIKVVAGAGFEPATFRL